MDIVKKTFKGTPAAGHEGLTLVTIIALIIYVAVAAPALPSSVAGLFDNTIFKIICVVAIVFLLRHHHPVVGILVALGFIASINTLTKYKIYTSANTVAHASTSAASGPTSDAATTAVGTSALPSSKDMVLTRSLDVAYGPNGVPNGESNENVAISHNGTTHRVSLRGYDYAAIDQPDLLPGGQGNLKNNANITAMPNMFSPAGTDTDIVGYEGGLMAAIGGENSQL